MSYLARNLFDLVLQSLIQTCKKLVHKRSLEPVPKAPAPYRVVYKAKAHFSFSGGESSSILC